MKVLAIPGWLMNANSFNKIKSLLSKEDVDIFECPGIDTADCDICVSDVISLIENRIKNYDVIIAHSYSINWLLQMKPLLSGKKIILLSPCYKNVVRMLKYLSILLVISKKVPIPKSLIKFMYAIIHTSKVDDNMIDGYFTCNAISAFRLLIQTLSLKSNESDVVESNVVIVHGKRDRLLKYKYNSLIKQFKDSYVLEIECGHDTFNYLPCDIL